MNMWLANLALMKKTHMRDSSFLEKNKIIELNTLLTSSPYIIHFDHTFDSKNNIKIITALLTKGGLIKIVVYIL